MLRNSLVIRGICYISQKNTNKSASISLMLRRGFYEWQTETENILDRRKIHCCSKLFKKTYQISDHNIFFSQMIEIIQKKGILYSFLMVFNRSSIIWTLITLTNFFYWNSPTNWCICIWYIMVLSITRALIHVHAQFWKLSEIWRKLWWFKWA